VVSLYKVLLKEVLNKKY